MIYVGYYYNESVNLIHSAYFFRHNYTPLIDQLLSFVSKQEFSEYFGNPYFFSDEHLLNKLTISAMESVFTEFEENLRIEGSLILKIVLPKEFRILIQCSKKNMCLFHQRPKLYKICKNHGIDPISTPWDINFHVSQILNMNLLYHSSFIFTFFKKGSSLFSA